MKTPPPDAARFLTTRWTMLSAAGGDTDARDRAREQFCRTYWYPVYSFIRRRGAGPEDAMDLTQGFFEKILTGDWLAGLERRQTRFSTLLLTVLKNFLASEYSHGRRLKRGGGVEHLPLNGAEAESWFGAEPATHETPERIFERRWALAVLEAAFGALKAECEASGKQALFAELSPFLSQEPAPGDYDRAGHALGLTANAVGVAVHRLRRQYRECVREEVAAGLRDPGMVDEELRHLAAAL